jgi:hypothetical protein
MLLAPKSYVPKSERERLDLELHPDDVLAREEHYELVAAQKILRDILKSEGINEGELRTLVESTGTRWYDRGEEITLPTTSWK